MHGRVTLSSGSEADYYIDLRRITLHRHGRAAGRTGVARTHRRLGLRRGRRADPGRRPGRHARCCTPAAARWTRSSCARRRSSTACSDGSKARDVAGRRVLVVEDVSTTGGSPLTAVDALREAGADVVGVAVIVDRGAREAIEAAGATRTAPHSRLSRSGGRPDPVRTTTRHLTWLSASARTREPWPDDPRLDPICCARATAATSSTATGTGGSTRSSPTSTPRRHDVRRRDRELAARPEHRHGRAHRERVPGPRGASSSAAAAGTGAARWSPTATSTCATSDDRRARPLGRRRGYRSSAIDNLPGALPIETSGCRATRCCCSARRVPVCHRRRATLPSVVCSIAQFGSTRSINAGVAAGIAMHAWIRQHAAAPDSA